MNTNLLAALTAVGFIASTVVLVNLRDDQYKHEKELRNAHAQIAQLQTDLGTTKSQLSAAKSELAEVTTVTIPKIREATEVIEVFVGDGVTVTGANGINVIERPNRVTDLSGVEVQAEYPRRNYDNGF